MIWQRLRMEGFLLADHEHKRPRFLAEMTPLVADGIVRSVETVTAGGIAQAWPAFLAMLDGATSANGWCPWLPRLSDVGYSGPSSS